MKKNQLLAAFFLTGICLGACTDEYTDWVNPQSNAPEDAAAKYEVSAAPGTDAIFKMDDFYANVAEQDREAAEVEIVKLSAANEAVASIALNKVDINGKTIDATFKDGSVKVKTLQLDEVVRNAYFSRAHVERTLDVKLNVALKLKSGEAVNALATAQTSFTPISTPAFCTDGYCLLGDFVESGGWEPTTPIVMQPVAGKEGVYQATVETKTDASNWFKFYEAYDPAQGWDGANKGEMGCQVNGDTQTKNFIVWTGDVYTVETPVIEGKGHFVVTLDAINFTYTIAPATAYLYMAGDANGWKQLDVLASPAYNNIFSGFMYLNQKGFKFSSEPSWNGINYGADFSTAGDAANIMMEEPEGFYKVEVNLNEKKYTLTPIANIGIIGDGAAGWEEDVVMELKQKSLEEGGIINYWAVTTDLKVGEIKFRADGDWVINWGGEVANLVQDGPNIKVETAGKYTVNLYPMCQGKSYCEFIPAE